LKIELRFPASYDLQCPVQNLTLKNQQNQNNQNNENNEHCCWSVGDWNAQNAQVPYSMPNIQHV
jgi:hypothetical protein